MRVRRDKISPRSEQLLWSITPAFGCRGQRTCRPLRGGVLGLNVDNLSRNVSGPSSDTLKPPPGIVAGIACYLGLTADEAYALVTDPVRAPRIMAIVRERFNLSDDYDEEGPEGLQLGPGGWLTKIEAQ